MKLASLKNDTRDGALCVVSRDLKHAIVAHDAAPTLQAALDDWSFAAPRLEDLYASLNRAPSAMAFAFDAARFHSPLPRAYQWLDASAYVNHVERVRKARGAEMPESFHDDPLMYQGASDAFLGPCDDVPLESVEWGMDFEAEIAVVTADVPMAVRPDRAGQYVRLVMLCNDWSLRELIPAELAKGFGFLQGKTWTAFSPVAVTPDELGDAWDGRKLHRPIVVKRGDDLFGDPDAGEDMSFNFPRLIAHAAKTRPLSAGTILGSGTVSNKRRAAGCACIVERRALEMIDARDKTGAKAKTPYMQHGERVRIEMLDADGRSIFGAIEQKVVPFMPAGRQQRAEAE